MTNDAEPLAAADAADLLSRLEHELSDELLSSLATFARRYLAMLRGAGVPVSPTTAMELVQDAACDTIEGRRPWDGRFPLAVHLRAVIRSNASTLARHHRRFRQVPLRAGLKMDETNPGDMRQEAELARLAPEHARPSRALSLGDAAGRLLDALGSRMADDDAACRALAAWRAGHTERADAIAASGLTGRAYDAARKRIQVMLAKLPDDLRDGAHDAMEVTHG